MSLVDVVDWLKFRCPVLGSGCLDSRFGSALGSVSSCKEGAWLAERELWWETESPDGTELLFSFARVNLADVKTGPILDGSVLLR